MAEISRASCSNGKHLARVCALPLPSLCVASTSAKLKEQTSLTLPPGVARNGGLAMASVLCVARRPRRTRAPVARHCHRVPAVNACTSACGVVASDAVSASLLGAERARRRRCPEQSEKGDGLTSPSVSTVGGWRCGKTRCGAEKRKQCRAAPTPGKTQSSPLALTGVLASDGSFFFCSSAPFSSPPLPSLLALVW